MNVQEFTQRTGYTPATEEEWKAIETMYMETGEKVDKDLFCREWLEHKDSKLLKVFYKRAMDRQETLEYFKRARTRTAKLLIEKAAELEDEEMFREASNLIGQKRAILYKVEQGYELTSEDKLYIKENLQ